MRSFLTICGLLIGIAFQEQNVIAANLIKNSSFEAGVSYWGNAEGNDINGPLNLSRLIPGISKHGNYSMEVKATTTNGGYRVSCPYNLKSNTTYYLSMWLRANNSNNLFLEINNTKATRTLSWGGVNGPSVTWATANSTSFTRYSTNWTTGATNTAFSFLFRGGFNGAGNIIYVDAIQLEEGELTEYSPANDVETALVFPDSREANRFFSNEVMKLPLWTVNHDPVNPKTVHTPWQWIDSQFNTVAAGVFNNTIPPNSRATNTITITTNKLGHYSVFAWASNYNHTISENQFVVLPTTLTTNAPDPKSVMGIHSAHERYFLEALRDVGAKFNRTLSTGSSNSSISDQVMRFYQVRPNASTWRTNHISQLMLVTNTGFTILGVVGQGTNDIHANVPLIDWADDHVNFSQGGMAYGTNYTNFAHSLSLAYPMIKHWETCNEAETEGGFDSPYHTNWVMIHTNTYTWLKNARSDNVVIPNFYTPAWFEKAVVGTHSNEWDGIFSHHIYQVSEFGAERLVTNTHVKFNIQEAWMTESGLTQKSEMMAWDWFYISFGLSAGTQFDAGSDPVTRAAHYIQNFWSSMAWTSFRKHFYYDGGRATTAYNDPQSHAFFDYDGALRTRAVSYAAIAQAWDGFRLFGRGKFVGQSNKILAYKASSLDGSHPFACVWMTNDNWVGRLGLGALTTNQVRQWDMFGNIVSHATNYDFGHEPIILEGIGGVPTNTFWNAFTFSDSGGIDTTPPKVIFTEFPTGTNGNGVYFRWAARDNMTRQFVTGALTNQMQYRHRLVPFENSFSPWTSAFQWFGTTNVVGFIAQYDGLTDTNAIFYVEAKDQYGNIGSNLVTFVVGNGSTSVVANPLLLSGNEDTVITGAVTGSAQDGNPLTFTTFSVPTHGSFTFQPNGSFTYTPQANFSGTDSFTFKANNGLTDSAVVSANLTVLPVNDLPVVTLSVTGKTYTENDPAMILDALATVTDVDSIHFDGGQLTVSLVANGSAEDRLAIWNEGTSAGQVGINGTDVTFGGIVVGSFSGGTDGATPLVVTLNAIVTPTVTEALLRKITYLNVSDLPSTLTRTVEVVLTEEPGISSVPVTLTIQVISVADDASITWATPGDILNGTPLSAVQLNAVANASGSFSYNPAVGTILSRGTHTLSVTFTPNDQVNYNPASAVVSINVLNNPPVATALSATTPVNAPVSISLVGVDADGDSLSFSIVTGPDDGVLSGTPPSVVYTPGLNYEGNDSFTFRVNDGFSDSLPSTVSVAVAAANHPPTLTLPGNKAVEELATLSFTLAGQDPDLPADTLTYSITAGAITGMSLNGQTGEFLWTPTDAEGTGVYPVTFRVTDAAGAFAEQSIVITVSQINLPPLAATQSVNATQNLSVPILLAGSDPEGSPLTYTITTSPTHGTLSGTAPSLTYTPTSAYKGPDSFTFTVNDGHSNSAPATVAIQVRQNPTLTWNNPAAIIYGTLLSATQLKATANVPGTFVYNPPLGTALNVGTNTLAVTFTPTNTTLYNLASKSVVILVNRATLTITAVNKSKPAGTTNPIFTATYTGLKNGDTAASLDTPVSFSTTATLTSPKGTTYPIIPSGASHANYNCVYVNGTLTIVAPLLASTGVTPANFTLAAKQTQQFTATGTYTDGSLAVITTGLTWKSANTLLATVSSAGVVTGKASGVTTISAISGVVTGSVALNLVGALTITAVNKTRPAGTTNPVFTATYTGFETGDTVASLDVPVSFSTTAVNSSPQGTTYPIVPYGALDSKYKITFVNGTLTIGAPVVVSIAVTPANATLAAGQAQQYKATATYSDGSVGVLSTGVTWKSGNTAYTTVTSAGIVTGKAGGVTTISATFTGITGNTPVTVAGALSGTFINTTRINGAVSGPAALYPSVVAVSGLVGNINTVTVRLNRLKHAAPADFDILLVSPSGRTLMLMSDAGTGLTATDITLTFADTNAASLPQLTAIAAGSYRPTDFEVGDIIAAPAPAGPFGSQFATFTGTPPNGTWSLYVMDDNAGTGAGSLLTGWQVTITTTTPALPNFASFLQNPLVSDTEEPRIERVELLDGGLVEIGIHLTEDGIFTLESSGDLLHWNQVDRGVVRSTTFTVIDYDAGNHAERFYRVRVE